jgi:hypothetical protein
MLTMVALVPLGDMTERRLLIIAMGIASACAAPVTDTHSVQTQIVRIDLVAWSTSRRIVFTKTSFSGCSSSLFRAM